MFLSPTKTILAFLSLWENHTNNFWFTNHFYSFSSPSPCFKKETKNIHKKQTTISFLPLPVPSPLHQTLLNLKLWCNMIYHQVSICIYISYREGRFAFWRVIYIFNRWNNYRWIPRYFELQVLVSFLWAPVCFTK